MIPHEKELVERLKNKPFALVGINTDKDKEYYKRQVAELGVTWRSSWQGGTNGPLCREWNVRGYPTIYVLDHKGVIRFKDVRGKQLDAAVDKLLQELVAESGEPPAK
jgi:hypothetical protein